MLRRIVSIIKLNPISTNRTESTVGSGNQTLWLNLPIDYLINWYNCEFSWCLPTEFNFAQLTSSGQIETYPLPDLFAQSEQKLLFGRIEAIAGLEASLVDHLAIGAARGTLKRFVGGESTVLVGR